MTTDLSGVGPPAEPEPPLLFPRSILDDMVSHAVESAPMECCGLLGGQGREVWSVYRLRNERQSEIRYSADPQDLIRAIRDIREHGGEIVGIYHSHPRGSNLPSKTDLRENFWGDVPRPIIGLEGDAPSMRVWRLGPYTYQELPWRVADDLPAD